MSTKAAQYDDYNYRSTYTTGWSRLGCGGPGTRGLCKQWQGSKGVASLRDSTAFFLRSPEKLLPYDVAYLELMVPKNRPRVTGHAHAVY